MEPIKVNIAELEKKLDKKLIRNKTILGIDSATKAGMALLKFNGTNVTFIGSIVEFGKHHKGEPVNNKLDVGINSIEEYTKGLPSIDKLVIEWPYLGLNRAGYGILSSMVGIFYAKFKPLCKDILLYNASTARKLIGFNSKKLHGDRLKKWVVEYIAGLGFPTESHDVADAVICGLSGAIKEETPKKTLLK